ncbi:MAG: rod shape-determining protein RodA [Actinomycetota bacterium]|jgi:rod shape determining protein RodA|tara:strand:- start:2326 stop:3477 length:1152 start_codon:yes stop_codon:yes gene_type:complete
MSIYSPNSRRDRARENFSQFDRILTFSVAALLIIGTLLVYAATKDWFANQGLDPEYYLKRHLVNILIGGLLAYGTTLIDYRLLRAYTPIVWALAVLGLVIVLIPGLGSEINGAQAWISFPGGFQIQPAELAKIAIIVGISMILAEKHDKDANPTDKDVMKALAIAAVPILLILRQPDLGTVVIISAAILTIIATSGAPTRWVVGLLVLAVIGGFTAIKTGVVSEYQVSRLQSFVDPSADPQATGYQLRQSRITIGSGGITGKGLFNGPQTNGRFVPEQQTDFIFTVAGEELGFIGSGFILLCYILFFIRAFTIARRTDDLFGRLVCVGVISWFAFQTFENIGMTMGMVPMTGVPLPFISYGGSSMFANLIGLGLIQNVHLRSR